MTSTKPIIFSLFSNPLLDKAIDKTSRYEWGNIMIRQFPDNETYIKINSDINHRDIIFIATLDRPNEKILPLLFAAETAKAQGANTIGLVSPYLAYMRQDIAFQPGEGITSQYFAKLLSSYFNFIVTIDPHLHRYKSLDEIYTIPATVLQAGPDIALWIKNNVDNPVLIGPDSESTQWVSHIAKLSNIPYTILSKTRISDSKVEISIPELNNYINYTPVIVDDIISTARTIIETLEHLKKLKTKPAVCIAIHAVFADDSYQQLLTSHISQVVTCNTISHLSNKIDISGTIVDFLNTKSPLSPHDPFQKDFFNPLR